jgi:transcriptional regulator with XRE-family HTH domain
MTPARKEPSDATYSGRIGIRLRELREKKGLSVEQFRDAIQTATGREFSVYTIYTWERATRDLPLDLIPVVARILGFEKATSWLPPY